MFVQSNAEIMASMNSDGDGFRRLFRRLLETFDPLVARLLRGILQWRFAAWEEAFVRGEEDASPVVLTRKNKEEEGGGGGGHHERELGGVGRERGEEKHQQQDEGKRSDGRIVDGRGGEEKRPVGGSREGGRRGRARARERERRESPEIRVRKAIGTFVDPLCELMVRSDRNPDLQVELISVLANIAPWEIKYSGDGDGDRHFGSHDDEEEGGEGGEKDRKRTGTWQALIRKHNLVSFLERHLAGTYIITTSLSLSLYISFHNSLSFSLSFSLILSLSLSLSLSLYQSISSP